MNWLPDMDLNHDKVIQSHLCYRYTIGQAGASGKLMSFTVQSRRETGRAGLNLDGGDRSPLSDRQPCLPVSKRGRARALEIKMHARLSLRAKGKCARAFAGSAKT